MGQQRQPPQACPCQHLHGICDPASCSKAIGSPSGVPFLFTKHSRARDWDEGARRGCMTCAAVMGAAQKLLVRSEDIITVRQWSGEFSVFDVPLFRERTNSKFAKQFLIASQTLQTTPGGKSDYDSKIPTLQPVELTFARSINGLSRNSTGYFP